MTDPDGLLVACPSCSAWPMPVRVRAAQRVGDKGRASFKCVKCGHSEGGSLKSKRHLSSPTTLRRRVADTLNARDLSP
jgi:hypothetical protein